MGMRHGDKKVKTDSDIYIRMSGGGCVKFQATKDIFDNPVLQNDVDDDPRDIKTGTNLSAVA